MMWARLIVFGEPGVEIGLQLIDLAVELLSKRHTIELVEQGLVEAFADAVGLRAPRLGTCVIDVLDGQVKLVFMAFGLASVLGAAICEHTTDDDLVPTNAAKYGAFSKRN